MLRVKFNEIKRTDILRVDLLSEADAHFSATPSFAPITTRKCRPSMPPIVVIGRPAARSIML
jgi:hypothetical protein